MLRLDQVSPPFLEYCQRMEVTTPSASTVNDAVSPMAAVTAWGWALIHGAATVIVAASEVSFVPSSKDATARY